MPADDIRIDLAGLPELLNRMPAADFIDQKYDAERSAPLTDILFILSTPRSGSTLLSDLFYTHHICLPHEYFQRFQYLPILADRWGCIQNGILDKQAFVECLIQYRTSENGWLGINLHGHHLPIFAQFDAFFPEANRHFIHMQRQDVFAQAVSYEIAAQTGKWSSHYCAVDEAVYSFSRVRKKLDRLHEQNAMINAYLNAKQLARYAVYYEDLLVDAKAVLEKVLPQRLHALCSVDSSSLKKQASERNQEWVRQFSVEYFATTGHGYEPEKVNRKKRFFTARKAK